MVRRKRKKVFYCEDDMYIRICAQYCLEEFVDLPH